MAFGAKRVQRIQDDPVRLTCAWRKRGEMASRFSKTSDVVQRMVSTALALTTVAGGTWLVANMGKGFAHYHRMDQAKREKEKVEKE